MDSKEVSFTPNQPEGENGGKLFWARVSSLILGKIKWFGPVYTFQDNSTLCGGIFYPKEEGRYHWTNQNSRMDRPMRN